MVIDSPSIYPSGQLNERAGEVVGGEGCGTVGAVEGDGAGGGVELPVGAAIEATGGGGDGG